MAFMSGRSILGKLTDILVGRRGEVHVRDAGSEWVNHETITVSTSVKKLDVAKVRMADFVLITCVGGTTPTSDDVRFWLSGADPSSTVGHILYDKDVLMLVGRDEMSKFRAIRRGSADATLSVSYGV